MNVGLPPCTCCHQILVYVFTCLPLPVLKFGTLGWSNTYISPCRAHCQLAIKRGQDWDFSREGRMPDASNSSRGSAGPKGALITCKSSWLLLHSIERTDFLCRCPSPRALFRGGLEGCRQLIAYMNTHGDTYQYSRCTSRLDMMSQSV